MAIHIKAENSYKDIDDNYALIKLNKNAELDLYLVQDITGKQLGIYPEIIQLIITWARLCNGKLYLHYEKDTVELHDKINTMFRRYWNFIAGCMGYEKGIFLSDNTNIQDEVAATIRQVITIMDMSGSYHRGNYDLVTCVQHSINPYPSGFYSGIDTLRTKNEFSDLVERMLYNVLLVNNKTANLSLVKNNKELIGSIVFELIENTHSFSRKKDSMGNGIDTGVRGVIIANHLGTKDTLIKNCREDKRLMQYIDDLNLLEIENNIIEISIFDSGPGLASNWLKKPVSEISYKEIISAIHQCLIYGNTSSNNSDYLRGMGFYNIMKLLSNTGYFSIRTNGVKLYRNFIQNPFIPEDKYNEGNYRLDDWYSSPLNSPQISEGTSISIFIPLTPIVK